MAPRFGHRGPVPGSRPAAVPQATLPTTALRWQSGQFHAQLTAETGMVSRVFVAKKTRLLEGHTRAVSRRPSAGECNGRKEPADSGPVRTSSTRKLGDFQKRGRAASFQPNLPDERGPALAHPSSLPIGAPALDLTVFLFVQPGAHTKGTGSRTRAPGGRLCHFFQRDWPEAKAAGASGSGPRTGTALA